MKLLFIVNTHAQVTEVLLRFLAQGLVDLNKTWIIDGNVRLQDRFTRITQFKQEPDSLDQIFVLIGTFDALNMPVDIGDVYAAFLIDCPGTAALAQVVNKFRAGQNTLMGTAPYVLGYAFNLMLYIQQCTTAWKDLHSGLQSASGLQLSKSVWSCGHKRLTESLDNCKLCKVWFGRSITT